MSVESTDPPILPIITEEISVVAFSCLSSVATFFQISLLEHKPQFRDYTPGFELIYFLMTLLYHVLNSAMTPMRAFFESPGRDGVTNDF